MVPIGSLVKVNESFGPDRVFHYNGYLAADLNGSPLPPLSSGQGEDLIAGIVKAGAARWIRVRVDRSHLPKDHRGQHRHLHLPAVHPARLHGARRAV
jgi:hypothetical protein